MLYKTRGIVFHQIKYAETSVIVKIYTEILGLQSYLIKGIRQKKSKIKSGLFQPLTLLDLVVYHKEKRELHHIKEIKMDHPLQSIPFDIRKSSIILFLNEILLKSIKEEEANKKLFDFIYNGIITLDDASTHISDFHLFFAIHLTKYLGFFPQNNYTENKKYFNLPEGSYQETAAGLKYYIGPELSPIWQKMHQTNFEDTIPLNVNAAQRQELLQKIFEYYAVHLPTFKEIKSIQILSEVLN